ncbi:MAG: rod shape-determining protein MreC [Clostridia bacterium]|nr:rod shape-determining protein MreC [Clostridia bacterium]
MARKRNRFYTDDTAFLPPPDWQKNQMQANTPADNRAYFPAENAGNIPSGEYWGDPEDHRQNPFYAPENIGVPPETSSSREQALPENPTEESPADTEEIRQEPIRRISRAEQAWAREAIRVDGQDPDLARRTWQQQDQMRGTNRIFHPARVQGEGAKKRKRKQAKDDQRSFIKSLIIIGVCVFLFLFTALMVVSNFVDHPLLTLPKKWATAIITPIQNFFSGITEGAASYVRTLKIRDSIEYEYEKALIRIDELANLAAQNEELRRENQALSALLAEQGSNLEMNPLTATVIGTDSNNYFSTLTLNVGSNQGVEPYMAVVSGGGLVGVTYNVESNKCQVRCIISTDCTVAALIQTTRDQGSIKGTMGVNGEAMCRMYYLPENTVAHPGDMVVTSGVGLEFPKGIPIGEVRESTRGMEDNKSYVVVEPIVDFQHLEYVTVYRYKPAYAEAAQSRAGVSSTLIPLSTPRAVPTFSMGGVSDFLFDPEDYQPGTGTATEATPVPTPAPTPAPPDATQDPNATPLPENLTFKTPMPADMTPAPTPAPTATPAPTPAPTQDPGDMTVEDD